MKRSLPSQMKGIAELSAPEVFHRLGDGSFVADSIVRIQIRLLDVWVPHLCFIVPDEILDPTYDILLGHDFMQIHDIRVKPKQHKVLIKKEALKMALRVRKEIN